MGQTTARHPTPAQAPARNAAEAARRDLLVLIARETPSLLRAMARRRPAYQDRLTANTKTG